MNSLSLTLENLRSSHLQLNRVFRFLDSSAQSEYETYRFIQKCENDEFKVESSLKPLPQNTIALVFHFRRESIGQYVKVKIQEVLPQGDLHIACDHCKHHCIHGRAALELLGLSLRAEDTYTDYDERLHELRDQIERLQDQQEKNIESSKLSYSIPADLKFIGISFQAENSSLSSDLFPLRFEKYHPDTLDPKIYKIKKYDPEKWPPFFRHNYHPRELTNMSRHAETYFYATQKMSEKFRFHFSDGRFFCSNQLTYHPLADLLPKDLCLNVDDQDNQKLDPFKSHMWIPDIKESQRLIAGLLQRLISYQTKDKSFKILIESSAHLGSFAEIASFISSPQKAVKWVVDQNSDTDEFVVTVDAKPPFMSWLNVGDYFWDPRAQAVLLVKPQDLYTTPYSACQKHSDGSVSESFFAPQFIDIAVANLRELKYEVEFRKGTHEIPSELIETFIDFNQQGLFQITHRFELQTTNGTSNVLLTGFSKEFIRLLRYIQLGIPEFKGAEARQLAARSSPKREMDMKLLKHMGVFHYILLELLSATLEKPGQSEAKFKVTFEKLEDRIYLLFFDRYLKEDSPQSPVPLKTFFSDRVLSYFKDFINWFSKQIYSRSIIYSEQGEIVLNNIYRKELHILHTLLNIKMSQTSDAQLFKARTDILKNIITPPTENRLDLILSSVQSEVKRGLSVPTAEAKVEDPLIALARIQKLTVDGIHLSINGRGIEELSSEDFKIQLLLNDPRKQKGSKSLDWFSLHPKVFLKGKEVDIATHLPRAQQGLIEYEGKLYLIPQGQIPTLKRLENFWLKLQGGKTSALSEKTEKYLSIPRSKVLDILALRASGIPVLGTSEWESVCQFYDSLGVARKPIQLPKTIRAELKPYQLEGVLWLLDLYNLKLGALLADDMGLGKTLQTLCFIEVLRSKKELGGVLIVVPPSLLYNWQSEIEKFVPHLKFTLLTGKNKIHHPDFLLKKDEHIYITTYGLLKEHEIIFSQKEWHLVIFDEAQNLKNISAQRTSAARAIKAQFKLCLTGTPMENHLGEFYSILDLAVPGCLDDLESFRKTFVIPTEINTEDLRYLKLKTKPLILRRIKKEILTQLPEKTETTIIVPFENQQKKIYRDVAISFNEKIQAEISQVGESKVQLQMLTALLRLRQICSDPSALPHISYKKTPPKLEALVDAAKEIIESGESILVFTQFLATLHRAEQLLKNEGLATFILHGGLSAAQKKAVISGFEKSATASVLILTLKTGGVGLNLTKASYVFHLEPWWNPAAENQATDRAHRMGQTKSVQVYRYIMHESVEEKIEVLKQRKNAQFKNLFSESEDTNPETEKNSKSGHLTKEDFALLLS